MVILHPLVIYWRSVEEDAMGGDQVYAMRATIEEGESESGPISLHLVPFCIVIESAEFDGDHISFLSSVDGVNYFPVYNIDGEASYPAGPSRCIVIDPGDLAGAPWARIRAGTLAAPAVQSAERVLQIAVRATN
jgi:hypothetical protein